MEEIIFYSVETLLLLFYIYYLVWQYSARDVPLYVKILTYFSWLLTFSIVLILPIDIGNSSRQSDEALYDKTNSSLFVIWRVMYWANFLLSWIILPFFQDYEDSGEFTMKQKMVYSIKKNLMIYGIGLTLGIILVLYLAIRQHLALQNIEGVLAGLGNFLQIQFLFSGLLLVVILLGYGLVAIPKRYIRESNEEKILEKNYKDAVLLDEARTEKIYELEDLSRTLLLLQKEYNDSEFNSYLLQILILIPNNFKENIRQQLNSYNASNIPEEFKPLTLKNLATLNRQVKRLMFDMLRVQNKFQVLCDRTTKLEKKHIDDDTQFESKLSKIWFKIMVIWDLKIRKYYHKYIGYLFAFISAVLVLGELCVLLKSKINFNLYNWLLISIDSFYQTQIFLLIPLTYMMFCTYYGLFAMKISGLISFNSNHHTDSPSLMFGSINFGRVSFPLCYNFISLTQLTVETQYSVIIGNMTVIPIFGSSFQTILPLMLLIMCFFNLFNIGDKIMKTIGLGQFAAQEEEEGLNLEGKKIMDREREIKNTKSINVQQELAVYSGQKLVNPTQQQQYAIRNFDEILNI